MKILFFAPPAAQRTGGLDAAIDGLRGALELCGIAVGDTLPADSTGCVAHFHGLWQPRHARLARECRARGIPYVVSPHGMLEPWAFCHKRWKKWPYFHLVEKHHLTHAAALLATALPEAERLGHLIRGQRIETLSLGLTGDSKTDYARARSVLGWRDGERVLLFLSRLHEKKGLELLLHALSQTEVPALTRLVIVGGGEERYVQSVRSLASTLPLPHVDWIGEVWGAERWKYFQGADLFCLPSYSENFGLAVLEACQVGTRALTTSTTPWGELLGNERGLICEPTIESVRKQLARFFAAPLPAPSTREALSAWAWRNFTWESLAPRYLALYRSLHPAT